MTLSTVQNAIDDWNIVSISSEQEVIFTSTEDLEKGIALTASVAQQTLNRQKQSTQTAETKEETCIPKVIQTLALDKENFQNPGLERATIVDRQDSSEDKDLKRNSTPSQSQCLNHLRYITNPSSVDIESVVVNLPSQHCLSRFSQKYLQCVSSCWKQCVSKLYANKLKY